MTSLNWYAPGHKPFINYYININYSTLVKLFIVY